MRQVVRCVAFAFLLGAAPLRAQPAQVFRRGPVHLLFEAQRSTLLVACAKSGSVARVDPRDGSILVEARVAGDATRLALHPDCRRIYVSCMESDLVVELDAESLRTLRQFPLQGSPNGLAVSSDGQRLFVGLYWLDAVAVIDLDSGRERSRLAAGNGPEGIVLRPGTGDLYVVSCLPLVRPPDLPPQLEVTLIDELSGWVTHAVRLENANIGRDLAFTADGATGLMAVSRPKNLIPMTQVARGWVIGNGFAVYGPDRTEPPVQLLVDLPNRQFADPSGLAIAPNDAFAYLTCYGADTVMAIDLIAVREVVAEVRAGALPRHANDLGLSRRYVRARIPVGASPVSVAFNADGTEAYVANRLDDSISVIETRGHTVARTLVLGNPPPEDKAARGDRLFHTAAATFAGQFSCSSCHPHGAHDGLRYDLEPDGIGLNFVDNRNLRGIGGTAPFKWTGTNPDITTQCGSRTAKWIFRTSGFATRDVVIVSDFIRDRPAVRSPYLAPDGQLSPAQRRGKAFFERTTTNSGDPLPVENRCTTCHAGPKFTDQRQTDVGSTGPLDTHIEYDNAHLNSIFASPPYLHDGRALTLEEIWTRFNDEDKHGVSSDWTKRQLNDLVEYLKSL